MPLRVRRTPRGFAVYTTFKDLNGKKLTVVKSSIAGTSAVWIQNEIEYCSGEPIGNAHLSRVMAKRVIKALQTFVDGVE